MDKISKEKRSKNMSKIKSHDTSIEIKVRKYLFSQGFRYRYRTFKVQNCYFHQRLFLAPSSWMQICHHSLLSSGILAKKIYGKR